MTSATASSSSAAANDISSATTNSNNITAPVKLSFTQQKLLLQRQLFLAESGSPQLQQQQESDNERKAQKPGRRSEPAPQQQQQQQQKPIATRESVWFSGLDDERMQRRRLRELQKRTDTLLKQFWHVGDDPMLQAVKRLTSTTSSSEGTAAIAKSRDSGTLRLLGRTAGSGLDRSSSRSSVKSTTGKPTSKQPK